MIGKRTLFTSIVLVVIGMLLLLRYHLRAGAGAGERGCGEGYESIGRRLLPLHRTS